MSEQIILEEIRDVLKEILKVLSKPLGTYTASIPIRNPKRKR